ncbi:hypothetical protein FRX31_014055 [Thalictrum thalictroides]|uniref:BRCT domain-containing protein n=1 Tax=Thalictrum thalictroides TaxID=46969 RepID=A0A7J6WIC8_THATH|nr:hypothetical protein FRX31_014055 [Thalictrum thalictroides]
MRSQEVDSDGNFCQKKFNDAFTKDLISKNTASQSLDGARQEKFSCDPHLAMNTSSAEKLLEPLLIQSLEEYVRVTRNQAKKVPVELNTRQSLLSSPQIHKFGNDESKEVLFIEQDKFKSRWLGGWTGKDFNVSEQKDRIADKTINKAVLRETSFISESADIVPDQNSVVKKLEDVPLIASLSSVAYEGLCSSAKGIELSQDLMSSYNLSMADPLCSVVPCSISLDDTNLNASNDKENTEKEADKCSNSILENELKDLQVRDTGSLADLGSGKGCIHKINGEGYVSTTRRQLASLKSYSMLMPTQKSYLERSAYQIGSVPNAGIPDFLTFEEDINCFKSFSRKETISYSKPTCKRQSNKKYREDRETLAVGAPMTESASHEEHNDETAHHEAEIEFHHQNERSSPLILNYRARRRLQASKVVLNNDIGDGNQEMASVPKGLETRDGFGLANTFAPIPPLHSSHPNPCEDQGPSRKRVRFLEAEANKCQQRSGQKPQPRCKTRSNTRTGERLKKPILRPDSRTQEEITCLTNRYNKDWKKMIFQGIEFLLTGFSTKKERELEMLIRKHGGFIVSDVPPPPTLGRTRRFKCKFQQFPVLITPKKVPTSKFLYGCAVNAFLLHVNWLTDSIMAGSLLPPKKYMILPNQNSMKLKKIGRPVHCAHVTHIFDKLGIMLQGKHSFCSHLEKIVRHGGGQVFKTLQWLVRSLKSGKISMGVIVVEDEVSASRHLRHCALEQKLPMMPANWITESLFLGKVIPIKDVISEFAISMGMSEEI